MFGNLIRINTANKRWEHYIIEHLTYIENFQTKDRTGYWSSENCSKTGRNTAYYKFFPVNFVKPQCLCKNRSQPRSDLGCRPLFTCRASRSKCYNCCHKLYWNNLYIYPAGFFVNCRYNLFGTMPSCIRSKIIYGQRTHYKTDRQEKKISFFRKH